MFLAIALLTLLLAATWLYTDRKKRFSMFRDLGIPGPPPSFLTGNLHEITEKGITAAADSWIKTYGNIIGFYSGSVPYVMINDAGWAKKILLEETHSFQAKGMMLAVLDYHPVISTNFSLRWGEPWKRMRSIVSPSFTPSSLKETFSVMSSCVDDFVGSLQDYACSGTAINVCEHCDILALEVIMRCVMGVETDAQKGGSREEQDLMRRVTTRRGTIMAGKFRIILNCLSEFPRFWWFILYLRTALLRLPVDNLGAYIKTIIKIRRLKYKGSGSTALDLMLSAEVAHSRSPKKATPETTTKGATTETSTAPNNQKPSINAVEILSTTGMLLVVG